MQPPSSAALPLEHIDHERLRTQHELFERARTALPRDPFPHYLAHARLLHGGRPLDVLFTSEAVSERGATADAGLLLAHYATSAFAEVLFSKREGETYELASSAGRVQGTLVESSIVSFRDAELALLIAPDRRLFRDADGQWWRVERPPARLLPRSDAAREDTPSLIDVELDPAQRHVVELAAGTSVLVLGEAGHGKTTVALHRLAEIERRARRETPDRPLRAAVILPTEGLRRLLEPLLVKLGLDVEVRVYEDWARAQAERAFPDLPARESQSASAGVIRLKRDPALRQALAQLARTRPLTTPRKEPQKPSRKKSKPLVRRRDLLHLFGDKPLLESAMHASNQRLGSHVLSEVLEHTHIQFSRTSEQEFAHVDRQRLRAVDGLPIDAGTPLEDAGSIDTEDYAVLFELDRLRAANASVPALEPEQYDCIVLDEAQEFAPLELALIGRSSSPSGSLIVAGDADQQTDPSACFTSWEESMRELGRSSYERAVLPVSYRCPPSVVAIAKQMLQPKQPLWAPNPEAAAGTSAASAPSRLGTSSTNASSTNALDSAALSSNGFVHFANECQLGTWLISELERLRGLDPKASVAVICRRALTARRLYGMLRHANLGRLVTEGDFSFRAGVNVTHVDQVKGLEFDFVIVPDASPATYPDQPDARRALYVAVTRARHQLVLGAVAGRSPLLTLPDAMA